MKYPDITEIIFKVVNVLEKHNIEYYIGGSVASSSFGIARSTLDVDIVADIKLEHAVLLDKYLKEEFYVDKEMIHNAVKQERSFNLIHLKTMFKVDIFVMKNRMYDKQVFLRRIQKQITESAKKKIFFAAPEDIILNKLEWYKIGGEISERQWNDVIGVMKVQSSHLDMIYLKKWAKELSVLQLLRKAIREVD